MIYPLQEVADCCNVHKLPLHFIYSSSIVFVTLVNIFVYDILKSTKFFKCILSSQNVFNWHIVSIEKAKRKKKLGNFFLLIYINSFDFEVQYKHFDCFWVQYVYTVLRNDHVMLLWMCTFNVRYIYNIFNFTSRHTCMFGRGLNSPFGNFHVSNWGCVWGVSR